MLKSLEIFASEAVTVTSIFEARAPSVSIDGRSQLEDLLNMTTYFDGRSELKAGLGAALTSN